MNEKEFNELKSIKNDAGEGTSTSTEEVLAERGNRYGPFKDHARITQQIKTAMMHGPSIKQMTPSQWEALEMIAHKIGRIVNGDPNYVDSWDDIAGYAQLVSKEIRGTVA